MFGFINKLTKFFHKKEYPSILKIKYCIGTQEHFSSSHNLGYSFNITKEDIEGALNGIKVLLIKSVTYDRDSGDVPITCRNNGKSLTIDFNSKRYQALTIVVTVVVDTKSITPSSLTNYWNVFYTTIKNNTTSSESSVTVETERIDNLGIRKDMNIINEYSSSTF
jgi:hypothetical protein